MIPENQKDDGSALWILRPKDQHSPHYFGRLREYALDKSHDVEFFFHDMRINLKGE